MTRVYIGMGSNVQPRERLAQALDLLATQYSTLQLSPVYESSPVGMIGANFLNLVVRIDTDETLMQLREHLRTIEAQCGRERGSAATALDLDILTWGDMAGVIEGYSMPRPGILDNAFVLQPLAMLAPDVCEPVSGQSWQTLWHNFSGARDTLWPVDFSWQGAVYE